jgi:fibronectin type 3 domain-containing protein
MEFSVFFRKIKAVLAMVNVFGKKVVSSVLAVLILLSVFLTLPMTAENVNAAVSAPTNLKVTEYSDKAAKLSWSKVAGVTGYLVYYSTDNSNFTKLKTINSQSTTSYTVGGLTAGKAYYFALISYTDINGKITKSERTSSLKITATSSSSVPAPSNLKVAEYSNSAIKLTWTKASDVTGYYVYRSTDGKKYSKIKTLKASTTAYTNTSLTAGKKYYYSIASYKNTSTGAVAIGPKSSAINITTTSSSSVPAPSNLKVAEYSNSAIKLTWTKASDVTGYYVYRSTDGKKYSKIKTLKAYTTAYTNTSLTAGKKYYYSIASYKNTSTGAVAIGPKSSAVNALTISSSKLSYPSGFAVKEVATDAIKLVWNKSSNASGYYIYRSIDNKNFSKIKALPSSSTSYTNTALYLDTTYYYKIASYVNSNGSIGLSDKSPVVNAKTTSTSVSFTSKTSTSTTITLNWDYPSATGYQIYRLDINTGKYVKIASTSAKSYTDKNLSSDRYYNYKVRAYLVSGGITTYSPYNSVSVKTCLPAVKDFKAVSQTYYSVNLSWTKQNGAVNYEIYQLSPDSQVYKLITTLNSDVTSYMVDNLTVNTTYKFRIRSVSSSKSYSDYSTLSITTLGATDDIIKANELYDEINKYRKSINLMQLKRDVSLDSIAITRAKEISQCFSDNRPDGTGWNTLLEEEGLGDYRFAGENIAKGMPDSASAVSVWLNRSVEGGNIREAIYTKIGVGVYCDRGVYHYVAIFYRPMKG